MTEEKERAYVSETCGICGHTYERFSGLKFPPTAICLKCIHRAVLWAARQAKIGA